MAADVNDSAGTRKIILKKKSEVATRAQSIAVDDAESDDVHPDRRRRVRFARQESFDEGVTN